MFCVYLNQVINNNYKMLQWFYDVIEDQKYYYSDHVYRKFD